MPSEIDTQKHQSARKLGNIFLTWKIHQYELTTAKTNLRIISPILEARGPRTTRWQLILWPYFEDNARKLFLFRLQRLENDHPPTVVSIDWKIALMTVEESLVCWKTGQAFFKGNSMIEYIVSDDPASIYGSLDAKSDTLLIYFQLIVSHKEANNSIETTPDIGLNSLSRDLLALYKRGIYSDVQIRIRDQSIRAHKAILQCRSPYFKDFIQQYENEEVLDIEEFSYKTVNNMLSYLYSGKLEFVLGKPSVAMYECAVRFHIEEVKRYYALDNFELESKINVVEMSDVWQIKNFECRDEHCIQSPMFTERVSRLAVRLMLYPKGDCGLGHFVSIHAKFRCASRRRYLFNLELGIVSSRKEFVTDSKLTSVAEDNSIMDVGDWPYRVVNSNISLNGTLSIYMKLQLCDSGESWQTCVTSTLYPFKTPNKKEHSYSRLSDDIRSLLTSGLFSDIRFPSDCKYFEVHKCILVARVHALKKQITEWSPVHFRCNTMDIKSDKINILMNYLYSGILNSCNSSDILLMYDVAEEYLLPTLKVICSRNLQKGLTIENVSDFLAFAEKKCDRELKLSALKFISVNSSAVFSQQNFQQLKTSHLHLYSEAHEFSRSYISGFTSFSFSEHLPNSACFKSSRSST